MIIAQRSTRHVLAGNHRLLAARRCGLAEVPVWWVDCDNDQAKRILLADNRTADLGTYDRESLVRLLRETGPIGTGYEGSAYAALLGQRCPEPDSPNPDSALEVETGQWWQVEGERRHLIVCGDAAQVEPVECDGVVTDPPYELAGGAVREIIARWAPRAVVLSGGRQGWALPGDDWGYRMDLVWRHRQPRSRGTPHEPVRYHGTILAMSRHGHKLGWQRPSPEFGSVIEIDGAEYDGEFGHAKAPALFARLLCGFRWARWADPFAGSASTLVAADAQAKSLVAIERDPERAGMGLRRAEQAGMALSLSSARESAVSWWRGE